jgi:hypothetical protein
MHDRRIKYELYIDSGDAEQNQRSLERFMSAKSRIEPAYGGALEWHPPDNAHRYAAIRAIGEGDITAIERHNEFMDWFMDAGGRLRMALESPLSSASSARPPVRAGSQSQRG